MDGCVQVMKRFEGVPSLSLLSSTQTPEVFNCLRAHVTEELKHDPTSWRLRESRGTGCLLINEYILYSRLTRDAIDGDIKETPRQRHGWFPIVGVACTRTEGGACL